MLTMAIKNKWPASLTFSMLQKKPTRRKKYLKVTIIVVAMLGILVLALNYWYVNNARRILKEYIYNESDGRIKLELSNLNLNLLMLNLNTMQLLQTTSQ